VSSYDYEYKRSIERPEEYWGEKKNLIKWFKEPRSILERTGTGRW
jgi:hypothetical protein